MEHVMVYWIGPLVGACVAVYSTLSSQKTQNKLCRPSVTFDERPSTEVSQTRRPSRTKKCENCDSTSRPNSSRPCITFDECPSTEVSKPCRPPGTKKCEICDSKSRSNSSRPCRCPCDEKNDEFEEKCCEDAEPSACRPSGCGITAQVRQTAVKGSKQLAYVFDIPPTVCRKGLRLRHNIFVTKKPKCESDICCPSPTCRDTSPDCPSDDCRRRSCYDGRDRSRSPERQPERTESESSRRQSRVRRPSKRRSSRNRHSENGPHHHPRHSARRSHSRRSPGRGGSKRSTPRSSPSRRHSRQRTSANKESHANPDATPKSSTYTYIGSRRSAVSHIDSQASVFSTKKSQKQSRAVPSHQRSVANTRSLAKAKPSKMSTADHKKSSTRPAEV